MPRNRVLPNTLADNLKKLRKSRGLTQEEITKALNERGMDITRQSYNRYENNNAGPDYDTLIKLADILGTDVNTLVGFSSKVETDKDKVQKTVFDMITSRSLHGRFTLDYNDETKHYIFKLPACEYMGSDGRFMLSSEGEVDFSEEQLAVIQKIAKKAWEKTFLDYFLQVLRRAKDNQPVDEFISKLQDTNGGSEINKEASVLATNTRI